VGGLLVLRIVVMFNVCRVSLGVAGNFIKYEIKTKKIIS
jgi:hypothetical protein